MAGHNKWSKIKRQKAKEDRRKSKIFSKLIREITVAAREDGGDPDFNPALRLAIERAHAENMPKDNIEDAIKRGTGELEGVDYEPHSYEGYGPGGAALYIECLTDNANRTVQDVRHALDTFGGTLGQPGSVAWRFDHKGLIRIDGERFTEDAVLRAALEAGAEDITREEGDFVVTCAANRLHEVRQAVDEAGLTVEEAELSWIPDTEVPVEGSDARQLARLLDELDDLDDVQEVYTNASLEEEALAG